MNKKLMKKRGELTSAKVVLIIILIAGFLIIGYFLYKFITQEDVNRDVCHESVVLRATMPQITQSYIPLKCKTAKFCITDGFIGGKCDGKGEAFQGEDGITKVKVKTKEDLERFIAREVLECWIMLGEGKISLFDEYIAQTYGIGPVSSSCVICSRIAFDKDLKIDLNKIDVEKYMLTHKAPGKDISYYLYLAGERGKISFSNFDFKEDIEVDDEGEIIKEGTKNIDLQPVQVNPEEDKKISKNELSVMFMQITAPGGWEVGKNTLRAAGIGFTGSFVLAPIFTLKAIGTAVKAWPVTALLLVVGGAYQQYTVHSNRAIAAGYCGDVSAGGEERGGCSVVRTVNYDIDEINSYCRFIESIP